MSGAKSGTSDARQCRPQTSLRPIRTAELEQIELLGRGLRLPEMLGCGLHAGEIEAQPLAGDLKRRPMIQAIGPEPVMRLPKVGS